jgi:hypothetical protein
MTFLKTSLAAAALTLLASNASADSRYDTHDWSNTIHTAVVTCDWKYNQTVAYASCYPPAGFVLIGGGAEVLGDAGLLTASYPSDDLGVWSARSKSHGTSGTHQLRAYAIGLKIDGVSESVLKDNILLVKKHSEFASSPWSIAKLPSDFTILGGGARGNWTTAGQLLVESRPYDNGWLAVSKDHIVSEISTVTSWAIGIRPNIPGYGPIAVGLSARPAFCPIPTRAGGRQTWDTLIDGGALASAGAQSTYTGAGRMLAYIIPDGQNRKVKVSAKDHAVADASGCLRAYAFQVMKPY